MKLLRLIPALAIGLSTLQAQTFLTLTDNSGKITIKAALLNLESDSALLRREDGEEFKTPLDLFNPDSQEIIRATWKEKEAVAREIKGINEALGQTLFSDLANIWAEPTSEVAGRLELPEESKTPYTSSYRIYTRGNYSFAGAMPKTMVAYGDETGKLVSISAIYSNKGDSLSVVGSGEDHFNSDGRKIDTSTLEGAMEFDTESIAQTLTSVLGKPTEQRMLGQGNKTNLARRWDWNGHVFLLTLVEEEYVGLQIVQTDFADDKGKTSRISDGEMRKQLLQNVTYEPNGDVYIKDIPMVDQGPKGYCAPATFERAMRHAGVAADMYLLATLATMEGGGTNTAKLYDEVAFSTRSKGGRTAREIDLKSLSPSKLKRYIEKGVPVMWQMCSLPNYNKIANARTKERAKVEDFSAYAEKIAEEAEENVRNLQDKGNYHICMIIGYNETTNEIAVSDSWGSNYTIRWIHVDEAEAVSNEGGFVIDI